MSDTSSRKRAPVATDAPAASTNGGDDASVSKKARTAADAAATGPTNYGTLDGFKSLFPSLRDDVIEVIKTRHDLPEEIATRMREMMDYNVPGGKLNRGLSVVHTLRVIAGDAVTPELERQAAVLGWCLEWMQAYFLVADDVMDSSHTRRGQPCWYRVPKVGKSAINDAAVLDSCVFLLVRKHFAATKYYSAIIDAFHEVKFQTEMGQMLDMESYPPGTELDLNRYTVKRWTDIVRYKTAFYTFYLPLVLGAILGDVVSDAGLTRAKAISLQIGEYFQAQDDFLDCYGDPAVIGKVGTDIQDAKCGWLVVHALNDASPEQREKLKTHYARDTPADIAAVKLVFKELGMEAKFRAYEESAAAAVRTAIDADPSDKLKGAYTALLDKIFKREK